MRIPTMERRKGQLTGHQTADCTVTISKMDGVESSRPVVKRRKRKKLQYWAEGSIR
jgi:hypothetical protein